MTREELYKRCYIEKRISGNTSLIIPIPEQTIDAIIDCAVEEALLKINEVSE